PARARGPAPTPTCWWARSRRRPRRQPSRRRRLPLRLRLRLRRRRQRQRRLSFPDDQARLREGVLDETVDLAGEEEADVAARVPGHLGTVPVLPQAAGLARGRHAITDAREQEAPLACGLGLQH